MRRRNEPHSETHWPLPPSPDDSSHRFSEGEHTRKIHTSLETGIHGPPGPGTDRSESVPDFQNFSGPGPVLGTGPNRSVQDQPVLVRGSLTRNSDNTNPM